MSYRIASPADLLADIREQSRRSLAERLLARVPQDVRSQMVAPVRQATRDLNEAQIVVWLALLDRLEVS